MVYLFSSLWVAQAVGMGFDLIVIVPLLSSCCGFLFIFGCKVSFFGRFQHFFLSMVVQQLVVILVFLSEEGELTSFYPTIFS